jgi:CHAT domain-containing protein/Tfp pilus assembly protein PilF
MFKSVHSRSNRAFPGKARFIAPLLILLWCVSSAQTRDVRSTTVLLTQDSTTATKQRVVPLELGVAIERELAGGQKHDYEVALTKGQFISVGIKLRGIDVRVTLQPPDGDPVEVLNALGTLQEGFFHRVTQSSGIYRLTVHARAKAPAGRYEIRLAELRPATESDRALQQARELIVESIRLNREGKYGESRPLLIRALEIREKMSGPDSVGVVQALNLLASNLEEAGDHAGAEPLHLRALKIVERTRGLDHPEVARQLSNLGSHYEKRGIDLKAEEMYQRALGILEKAQLVERHIVAAMLGNLGSIYYARGDYENAEKHYQRARAVWEKLLGPDHFHLEPTYIFLGRVAYDAGDYAKAKAMFERALTLREKALGQEEPGIPRRLNDLAMLYSTTGDYTKAESFYRRALSIYEKGGMSDPNAQDTLFGLARLHAAQGRESEALKFQTRASEIEERYIGLNLAVGSERERLAFLASLSLRASRNISLHTSLESDDRAARDLAVTTILRRKGRALDGMADSLAALRRRASSEDQALFEELNNATSRMARLILNRPQNMTLTQHQNEVKILEEQREKLEADISRRSAGFYEKAEPVTLAAVQTAIPETAALVEFAVYRPFDPKAPDNQKAYGDPHYVAYVIRRQGDVQWAKLGEAKKIEDAISALRQAVRTPTRTEVRSLARSLDEKVMQPVRALLGDATQLLVSPDGELNLVPFAALVDEQGRYLVQHYSFTYLTSGRDLLRMQVARENKSQPLVIANPSFGAPATELLATTTKPTASRSRRRSITTGRDLSDVYFAPLGGTAQEARSIQTLFPDADVLTAAQATESAVKQINAPRVLHLATHGFFLSEPAVSEPRAAATGSRIQPGSAPTISPIASRSINARNIANPLLRSGLALAGANLRTSGNDDGILTALEASGLNLWGTKLVVLSACDTGIGEVRNGEGVYGLRRAFVLAGAESLVMSLWPVSDYSTRKLMTEYYKNLKLGKGRGEALRQVQLTFLKQDPKLHPFYWANFIQSGEWANLNGRR